MSVKAGLQSVGSQVSQIRIKGKNHLVPSLSIQDRIVVLVNRWPRIAAIKDEDFVQGIAVEDPKAFIAEMRRNDTGADLLTFAQKFPDLEPRYDFHAERDSIAAIPITSYEEWWNRQISGNLRKLINRSSRRGVSVRQAEFNDEFVSGVVEIYNENPMRQNRPFWHYGKSFDAVKSETGTYLNRSVFLGAYWEGKMIGYLKIVFVDRLARLMQIIAMTAHRDKLPTNFLIAKAVELSAARGCSYLTYGRFIYGKMGRTSLTDFKERNGFQQYLLPRYYIPLSRIGKIALGLKVHKGFKELIPKPMLKMLAGARIRYNRMTTAPE